MVTTKILGEQNLKAKEIFSDNNQNIHRNLTHYLNISEKDI